MLMIMMTMVMVMVVVVVMMMIGMMMLVMVVVMVVMVIMKIFSCHGIQSIQKIFAQNIDSKLRWYSTRQCNDDCADALQKESLNLMGS